MPYAVRQHGSGYAVVKKKDGKVIGTHKTRGDALKQIVAIRIHEGK